MELLIHMGLMITLSAIFMFISHKMKQPLILGYILAGLVLSPFGLGIITAESEIIMVGELGIVFLLFSAGIEIDLKHLTSIGFKTIAFGALQIIICFLLGFGFSQLLGFDQIIGLHFGLLIAFSSTMIATKILVDKGEINSLHGRIIITLLILQDIIAIIALMFASNIGNINSEAINGIIINTEILVGVVIFLIIGLPYVLNYAAKDKSLLYMTSLAVLFLMLGLVNFLNFPWGIGGFLAGVILANTIYKSNIRAEMKPLREFFAAIFFVSLGVQFNPVILLQFSQQFLGLLFLTSVIKPLLLISIFLLIGYGLRNSLLVGLLMAQSSEFSFILAGIGFATGQFGQEIYSLIISTVVISILITPYLAKTSKWLYNFLKNRFKRFRSLFVKHTSYSINKPKSLRNHIIIVGAHRVGKQIIDQFKSKYQIMCVEHDPELLKELQKEDIYHIYGDITNEEILSDINMDKAKMVFLTIPDINDQLYVIDTIQQMNKKIKIIGRAHSKNDALILYKHGADHVIVPEYISGTTTAQLIKRMLISGKSWTKHKKEHIKELEEHMF